MKAKASAGFLMSVAVLVLVAGCGQSGAVREDEEEKVGVGYGEIEASNVTSPVNVLNISEKEARYATSVADLIVGRIPGVMAVSTPYGMRLQIRGVQTLVGSTDPLYVVDGTPTEPDLYGTLSFLNPRDVVRIEVLKGAAASIYGSRGGNGVIMITTRRR